MSRKNFHECLCNMRRVEVRPKRPTSVKTKASVLALTTGLVMVALFILPSIVVAGPGRHSPSEFQGGPWELIPFPEANAMIHGLGDEPRAQVPPRGLLNIEPPEPDNEGFIRTSPGELDKCLNDVNEIFKKSFKGNMKKYMKKFK